jgi:hypothetical protein
MQSLPPLRADVAQLVEQRFRKPQVTGSNPVVGSSLCSQRSKERRLRRQRKPVSDADVLQYRTRFMPIRALLVGVRNP